jgi:hypothetical protein
VRSSRLRRLALTALITSLAVLAAGAGAVRSAGAGPTASTLPLRFFSQPIEEPPGAAVRHARLADIPWNGGPITTSTGETVTVFVSASLDPTLSRTPEQWADFLVHLDHGPEISDVTVRLATLDEVQTLCGARALGCYGDGTLISVGQTLIDGTTSDEVVRHEYGHHIAANRVNPPWLALDWGPKYWASAAGICARVQKGSAFPGDEGAHYDQNPGEAWAETYRVLEEQKAGILTGDWQIVSRNFFPNTVALAAAERDVLQPWAAGKATTYRMQFTKKGKKVWLIHLPTPLDGTLSVKVTLPKTGQYDVAVLGGNRRTVLRRALEAGSRTRRLSVNVCGQRSLFARVTDRVGFGRVSATVAMP